MRVRRAISPTLVLVITLILLALLEWLNFSGSSSSAPIQDVPRVSYAQHATLALGSASFPGCRPAVLFQSARLKPGPAPLRLSSTQPRWPNMTTRIAATVQAQTDGFSHL